MFADRHATLMIPAHDLDRARRWYEEKLGLRPERSEEYGHSYRLAGGADAFLYPSEFAGTAGHTLLSFASPDLLADMKAMRARGIVFEDYDLPGIRTVNGVADFGPVKNAWAKDSEGNILGFVQGM